MLLITKFSRHFALKEKNNSNSTKLLVTYMKIELEEKESKANLTLCQHTSSVSIGMGGGHITCLHGFQPPLVPFVSNPIRFSNSCDIFTHKLICSWHCATVISALKKAFTSFYSKQRLYVEPSEIMLLTIFTRKKSHIYPFPFYDLNFL